MGGFDPGLLLTAISCILTASLLINYLLELVQLTAICCSAIFVSQMSGY